MIVDLSASHGASINDAIPSELASLRYPTVDQAAAQIPHLSPGALIAKLNFHSAYRREPVHSMDHHLLDIQWQGHTYLDQALLFGLRSALKLFTAVADGYAWALVSNEVINFLHY